MIIDVTINLTKQPWGKYVHESFALIEFGTQKKKNIFNFLHS